MAEQKMLHASPVADEDLPLIDCVLASDVQAFNELVHRHERRVYRIAIAVTRNRQDAEDVVQEALFNAYKHLKDFQRTGRFSTWLTRIVVNEALQKFRRKRFTDSLDDLQTADGEVLPKRFQDWHDDPEALYGRKQVQECVEEAIQSLPPIYREAFLLHDVEGLAAGEIAEALHMSLAGAKSRILRARLMMREALSVHFQRPRTPKSTILRVQERVRSALTSGVRRIRTRREDVHVFDCKRFLTEISDYLDGESSSEVRRELEKHLALRHQCSVVLNTTRQTLRIVADCGALDLPFEATSDFGRNFRSSSTGNNRRLFVGWGLRRGDIWPLEPTPESL